MCDSRSDVFQCADRIHRLGQLRACTIKHLDVVDSMDTALLMIQVIFVMTILPVVLSL
jgi:hypothetical protein